MGSVELRTALLAPLLALLIAMAAGHLLVLAFGESPWRVLQALLAGTWGSWYGVGQVLFKATPLVLTGLAVALPFRAGLFNIGAEGQAVLGALATGLAGAWLPAATPWPVALPLAAAAGFAAGALWGALPGWLKGRFGAHEVISTIMLNFIALALANYLVAAHFAVPETLHTAAIVPGAELSRLGDLYPALHGSAVSTALPWAVVAAVLCWWLLFRTATGYELRAVGQSPRAAHCTGLSLLRVSTLAMALGGGLSGLVGMGFVQGYKHYYEDGFSAGIGFMGIAVALLGRNHPLGVVLAALLFGTLSQGGLAINALVPKEIVEILQAVIILAVVAASRELRSLLQREGGR
ncbi:MAG: ABC transporter permease [Deltaproteobacteria bacterium]|nr:ABC transporter permease [Deltaproteobacteria bacterium]